MKNAFFEVRTMQERQLKRGVTPISSSAIRYARMFFGFRKAGFIILTLLVLILVSGPSLSYASKLPSACNIFHKSSAKAGVCGHRAMLSKSLDKFFDSKPAYVGSADFAVESYALASNRSPFFFYLPSNLTQSDPLRC